MQFIGPRIGSEESLLGEISLRLAAHHRGHSFKMLSDRATATAAAAAAGAASAAAAASIAVAAIAAAAWRRSPRAAIERLPLSPAARLTGAASQSASIARAIRFLLAFPGTPCCVTLCDFGPGVVRLREESVHTIDHLLHRVCYDPPQ